MSHDGKSLSALYARDSGNNESSGLRSERKRSRFDEVGAGNEDRERNGDRSEYRTRDRESKDTRDPRDRESRDTRDRDPRDSRDDRDRDSRDTRDSKERNSRDYRDYRDDGHRSRTLDRDSHHDDRHREKRDHDKDYERDRERDRLDSKRHRGDDRDDKYDRYRRERGERYRDDRRSGRSHGGGNVEIPFDRFLRLSPWRGPVTPLEERPRHLKNWDAAPAGFERISADKAKLTGLFPPPGNMAKTANYVPPTLDPARAAMFQLLNKDNNTMPAVLDSNTTISTTTSASNVPANLMKQAKRFYVGNLPFNFNESALMKFLESNLRGLSRDDDQKILNIHVSSDRSYAFVECRTLEDASLAMNLDGVLYEGSQLKIRRPKEYHMAITSGQITPSASASVASVAKPTVSGSTDSITTSVPDNSVVNRRQLLISGVPECLTAEHVKSLLLLVTELRSFLLLKDGETEKSLGVAIFEFLEDLDGDEWSAPFLKHSNGSIFMGPFEMKIQRVCDLMTDASNCDADEQKELRDLLSVYNLQPGYATAPSSTQILQLLNMVTRESLQSDYEAIYDDLKQELSKYSVNPDFELIIPKPAEGKALVPGLGKVFVKYGSVEEAAKAASELAGRIFDGHTCIVSFYPPEKYEKRLF